MREGVASANLIWVRKRWRGDWLTPSLIFTIFAALLLFVLYPLIMVLRSSFTVDGAFSLKLYAEAMTSTAVLDPLCNSLVLGLAVALCGTAVGYLFAYGLTMHRIPLARTFRFLAMFPMISPPFIVAIAAIMLFGRNGWITRNIFEPYFHASPSIYGFWGLLIVETLTYFPTAFLVLSAVFASIDPVLEESAMSQGARPWQVFRDVIFPLTIPGILSSLLLIFIESLADFGNPLVLSGDFKISAVQAYLKITGEYDPPRAAVVSMFLLLPSLAAFFVQKYWVDRKSFVTLSGKPSSSARPSSSPAVRRTLFTICAALSSVVILFYGVVVFGSFVKVWGADNTLTVANYVTALTHSWSALGDSLLLSAIATPITGLLGMIIAYLVVRKRFFGRTAMETISMLSFAVPGTVVGIGYVLAFNERPFLLTGTGAIIVLMFIFRNMPVGIKSGITAIRQMDVSIEEASTNLGAAPMTTFRRVTLPLLAPAFFTGLAYSFVRCITAISAVIFVVSGQWNLVTVSILGFVETSHLSTASAMCMVLVAIVAVALAAMRFFVLRMGAPAK